MKIVFALMMSVLFLSGCLGPKYLSPEFTFGRKVEMKATQEGRKLLISGLCGHSAYGIDELKQKEKDDSLFIQISLKPNARGDFIFYIPVPDHINKIYWENELIWSR